VKFEPSLEEFLREVRGHVMEVVLDQGVHRHIRFATPGTGFSSYSLTTWPDHLALSGDLGCYVFRRTEDMFEFFRQAGPQASLTINPYYWGEKVVAADVGRGMERYSPERFREAIMEMVEDGTEDERLEGADVAGYADHGQEEATRIACDFGFESIYDYNLTAPSYGLIWALWAVAWGVWKYDQKREEEQGVGTSRSGIELQLRH